MSKIIHTPLTAAQAIRAGFDAGKLGRIAKTAEDHEEMMADHAEMRPVDRPFSGLWLNAYKASLLVTEQCPKNTPSDEIRLAIEQVFPELFADYWEKVFSPAVSA